MSRPPDPRRAAAVGLGTDGGDKITGEGDRQQDTTVVEVADLTVDEATALVGRIRQTGALLWAQLVKAFEGRAWIALGYSSWDELCDAEFAEFQLRLPREERREVVASLRESGMSTRAIASATGSGKTTIIRDLSRGPNGPPDSDGEVVVDAEAPIPEIGETTDEAPLAPVVGLDGKTYKPNKASSIRAEQIADLTTLGLTTDQVAGNLGITPNRVSSIAKSAGITLNDANGSAKPRRHPLPQQANDAGWQLRKAVERIDRIYADDRFGANKEQVLAHTRDHLYYASEVVLDLLCDEPLGGER